MIPADPSNLLSTEEAARMAGVKPPTIRKWRARGLLAPQGLDERGYPMHSREAIRTAEELVRELAITKGGFDPRRTRGRPRKPRQRKEAA